MKETYANNPALVKRAMELRQKTCVQKYGVDDVAKVPEHQDRWKATKQSRYGYTGSFQNLAVQQQMEQLAHTDTAYEKRHATCEARYGAPHHMKNEEKKQLGSKTYKARTGYANPMVNPEVRAQLLRDYGRIGATPTYYYKGIWFDSSWEIALYIWLTDHNKAFIYHPIQSLSYVGDDGRNHEYYPDFLVEGRFYEIKGTQFFNEKGEPFNNYTKKFWWGKYNKLKEFGVVLILQADMKPYLSYIQSTYGKNYLQQFKQRKSKK